MCVVSMHEPGRFANTKEKSLEKHEEKNSHVNEKHKSEFHLMSVVVGENVAYAHEVSFS